MSGHSKWATTKHRKAAVDKARAKVFAKVLRQVEVAAREGGGDPDANPTLRTMFEKARAASIPMDTIERAIKRGTGELEGVRYEQINYEGYAPAGVALIVEALTDNRNRTGADVRHLLNKHGGSLGEPGSVAYLFDKQGVIVVDAERYEEEDLLAAVDAGAQDIERDEDCFEVITAPGELGRVRQALADAGVAIESADLAWRPKARVSVEEGSAGALLRLIDALEDSDDVTAVHANFDVDAEVLERIAG
jgi:YebC/PmpR family DNA-binding regulatory protein